MTTIGENDGMIQLFFKTLTNRTRVLRAYPSATILELKQQFFDVEGVPVDDQRLIYSGKELVDEEHTLLDYNILHESTIVPVLRLRGGATIAIRGSIDKTVDNNPFHRYKMPPVVLTQQGARKAFTNIEDVSRAIALYSPLAVSEHITSFLNKHFGAQFQYKNGAALTSKSDLTEKGLQDAIHDYIEEWILCQRCKYPETELISDGSYLRCKCGGASCGKTLLGRGPTGGADVLARLAEQKKQALGGGASCGGGASSGGVGGGGGSGSGSGGERLAVDIDTFKSMSPEQQQHYLEIAGFSLNTRFTKALKPAQLKMALKSRGESIEGNAKELLARLDKFETARKDSISVVCAKIDTDP